MNWVTSCNLAHFLRASQGVRATQTDHCAQPLRFTAGQLNPRSSRDAYEASQLTGRLEFATRKAAWVSVNAFASDGRINDGSWRSAINDLRTISGREARTQLRTAHSQWATTVFGGSNIHCRGRVNWNWPF